MGRPPIGEGRIRGAILGKSVGDFLHVLGGLERIVLGEVDEHRDVVVRRRRVA